MGVFGTEVTESRSFINVRHRDWVTAEGCEQGHPSAGRGNGATCPESGAPYSNLSSELGVSALFPACTETLGCLLPGILTRWYFEFRLSHSSQETLHFWVSLQGENVPTYIFPEVLVCSLPRFPISSTSPVPPACASHLDQSVMPLSILQSLYTSKQTNRDPNTPQQAYCQRISSHAGAARRIQIRIA